MLREGIIAVIRYILYDWLLQVAQEEKETLNGELQDLVKEKARLELNIKDMKKEVEDDSNARVSPLVVCGVLK